MRITLIGAVIGFLIGAVLGGGPFGLLGLIAGGGMGAFAGAMIMPIMTASSADEYSRHPHMVSCPATGTQVPVMVTRESARAASFQRGVFPIISDCPRWRESGKCSGPCAKYLNV